MKKIAHIVGARPNFMKIAPLMSALDVAIRKSNLDVSQLLVHTGQHYSREMSELLFEDLGLPKPDINLEVGSGSHGVQTGRIMEAFDAVLDTHKPDIVVVVGDVNSTIACALDAVKRGIRVAHVEAGLRSFDRAMPEEINRILTDQISDWLFTTEEDAAVNLAKEGIDLSRVHFTGNVMIDTLMKHKDAAIARNTIANYGLQARQYGVVTLHRPSNVDNPDVFAGLLEVIQRVNQEYPLIWPMHPRAKAMAEKLGFSHLIRSDRLHIVEPLGYLDFMSCVASAEFILTDSGGIQEETTVLKVPCITLRENTERPITITHGSNVLAGVNPENIWNAYRDRDQLRNKAATPPPKWDGKAGERIADILLNAI